MNPFVKNIVENFYDNTDVIIEGEGPKTWNLEGISISLKEEPLKYFVLLTCNKADIDWLIHFENDSNKPFTDQEKHILFNAVSDIIDKGDVVTTEGGVTPGGISALKKLKMHGYKEIGTHKGKNVYWASPRILDANKFNEWIVNASTSDYSKIDKKGPLTIENTRPIVLMLEKL